MSQRLRAELQHRSGLMPETAKSAEPSDSHELAVRPRLKDKASIFRMLEVCLQSALAWLFQFLLYNFISLQDSFLAIPVIRRLVAFALMPRCQATVTSCLQKANDKA